MFKWIANRCRAIAAWFRNLGWLRRQIYLILMVLFGGWIGTAIIAYVFRDAYIFRDSLWDEMGPNVFYAWTGELAFFTIVGGIITVISLSDPMHRGFDERMKIMFGQLQLPDVVMKYNKEMVTKLSAYAKYCRRNIILETYDSELHAYKGRIETTYELCNILRDVPYSDTVKIRITPDDFGTHPPTELGRIIHIMLGNDENIRDPLIIEKDGLTTELRIEIPANGTVIFKLVFLTWIKTDALQSLRPERVVEQFSMEIVSQCDQPPRVEIDGKVQTLLFNKPVPFHTVQGVTPGETVGVYKALSPVLPAAPISAPGG